MILSRWSNQRPWFHLVQPKSAESKRANEPSIFFKLQWKRRDHKPSSIKTNKRQEQTILKRGIIKVRPALFSLHPACLSPSRGTLPRPCLSDTWQHRISWKRANDTLLSNANYREICWSNVWIDHTLHTTRANIKHPPPRKCRCWNHSNEKPSRVGSHSKPAQSEGAEKTKPTRRLLTRLELVALESSSGKGM